MCVHVVEGDGPNLMGRDWLSLLEVNLGGSESFEE